MYHFTAGLQDLGLGLRSPSLGVCPTTAPENKTEEEKKRHYSEILWKPSSSTSINSWRCPSSSHPSWGPQPKLSFSFHSHLLQLKMLRQISINSIIWMSYTRPHYPPCLSCMIQRHLERRRHPQSVRRFVCRSDSSRLHSLTQSPVEVTWINQAQPVVLPDSSLYLQTSKANTFSVSSQISTKRGLHNFCTVSRNFFSLNGTYFVPAPKSELHACKYHLNIHF